MQLGTHDSCVAALGDVPRLSAMCNDWHPKLNQPGCQCASLPVTALQHLPTTIGRLRHDKLDNISRHQQPLVSKSFCMEYSLVVLDWMACKTATYNKCVHGARMSLNNVTTAHQVMPICNACHSCHSNMLSMHLLLTNVADDGGKESRLVLQVEVVLFEGQMAFS